MRDVAFGVPRPKWDKRKKPSAAERKKESDSLAAHNIPENLWGRWQKERSAYPYDLPPDERAARFLEDMERNWDEHLAQETEKWERHDYAKDEAEHYAQEVPF